MMGGIPDLCQELLYSTLAAVLCSLLVLHSLVPSFPQGLNVMIVTRVYRKDGLLKEGHAFPMGAGLFFALTKSNKVSALGFIPRMGQGIVPG